MVGTRGPQVVLEGYARSVARGIGRTMRDNIAAMDALVSAGLTPDGNAVDGKTRNGSPAYDQVVAQFPHEELSQWEIPAPLLNVYGSSTTIASRDAAMLLNLTPLDQVVLLRWTPTSQYAPAVYARWPGNPGHGGAFQDVTGAWFNNAEPVITPEMFGAMGQPSGYAGPLYDDPAFQIAINVQRPIRCMSHSYRFGAQPIVPNYGTLWIENGLAVGQPLFTGISGLMMFGTAGFVRRLYLKDIRFDGLRDRSLETFPYSVRPATPPGFIAVLDFHADQLDETSRLEILGCTFQNTYVFSYHATMFKRNTVDGNKFIRTADNGFIAGDVVRFTNNHTKFCSDNGVSVSRGTLNAIITDNVFEDCELAGIWFAGYNTTNQGSVTITGTYTMIGQVSLLASAPQFEASLVNTFITAFGSGGTSTGDCCTIKITAFTDSTHATGYVMAAEDSANNPLTSVPADLQGIPSVAWQGAPLIGVGRFTIANNIIVGAYNNAIDGVTAPKHGNIGNCLVMRTGCIADSEVLTQATVASGSSSVQVSAGGAAKFPVNSYAIFLTKTSYQDYFMTKVTASNTSTDVLTISPTSPRPYAQEDLRLLHVMAAPGATGCPINLTGSSVGYHEYAEDITIHDMVITDFVGIGARLGNTANGSVRNIRMKDITFSQPAGFGNITGLQTQLIRIEEYPGTRSDGMFLQNITTDNTTGFIALRQRGASVRKVLISPNTAPNVSDYFTAVDLDNANVDVSASYATVYTGSPADPTGTTSLTAVMMGFGSTVGLIAQKTGMFEARIIGNMYNATSVVSGRCHLRYGITTIPTNGQSVVGIAASNIFEATTSAAGGRAGFSVAGICGFTPNPVVPLGTRVWFDLAMLSNSGTLVTPRDLSISVRELDSREATT